MCFCKIVIWICIFYCWIILTLNRLPNSRFWHLREQTVTDGWWSKCALSMSAISLTHFYCRLIICIIYQFLSYQFNMILSLSLARAHTLSLSLFSSCRADNRSVGSCTVAVGNDNKFYKLERSSVICTQNINTPPLPPLPPSPPSPPEASTTIISNSSVATLKAFDSQLRSVSFIWMYSFLSVDSLARIMENSIEITC